MSGWGIGQLHRRVWQPLSWSEGLVSYRAVSEDFPDGLGQDAAPWCDALNSAEPFAEAEVPASEVLEYYNRPYL